MTPSPFEVSRTIGNQFGKTNLQNRDTSAIDEILKQSVGNPQQLQNSIGQILSRVSPERQPAAIKFLEDRYRAVQQQEDLSRKRQAAVRGGYDADAPAGVQTQQVKHKQNLDDQERFLYGSRPQSAPLGHPEQTQAEANNPPNMVQQNSGGSILDKSDEELIAAQGIPSLKNMADAALKTKQANRQDLQAKLKSTEKQRLEYANKGKYARQGINNKKQQIALLKTGKIDTPTKTYIAGLLPGAIGNQVLSPETQLYRAGLFEEFGVLKSMFPGQIRVKEIELLEDKLATLDKSHAAKEKILENGVLKLEQDVILAKHAAKIEKERPEAGIGELDQLIFDSAKDDLDQLYDKIIKGYENIYIDYAKPQTTFVDQNGLEYKNVPKKDLRKFLEEAKQNGIELRPK